MKYHEITDSALIEAITKDFSRKAVTLWLPHHDGEFYDHFFIENTFEALRDSYPQRLTAWQKPLSVLIIVSRMKDFCESGFHIALTDMAYADRRALLNDLYKKQWGFEMPETEEEFDPSLCPESTEWPGGRDYDPVLYRAAKAARDAERAAATGNANE